MKQFPEEIKLNDKYSFYVKAMSVLPTGFNYNDPKVQEVVNNYVKERKKNLFFGFGKVKTRLSIAPTGFCAGRCYGALDGKGCYAASFFNETEYLSVEKLKEAIEKYNVDLSEGDAIIYGGEPCYNWVAFEKLLRYLSSQCKRNNVSIVTSTFYNESTFNKLKDLYKELPNFGICVSLDNKYDQHRLYPPLNEEQSHNLAYGRFKQLYEIDPKRVAIRSTIIGGKKYWNDYIREVESDIGGDVNHNCDWLTSGEYSEDSVDEFLSEFSKYISYKETQSPKFVYGNFRNFSNYDSFAGIIKGCDVNIKRLAINHKGQRICCVDNLNSTEIEAWMNDEVKDYTFNTNHKICENCNAKNLCFSKCFYAFAEAPCHYNLGLFIEWLKWQAKRDINKLIKMSVIQEI